MPGLYLLITPRGDLYFLADATVNIEPDAEDLAEIAIEAAAPAKRFSVEPRVAMLSFSNFGSTRHPLAEKAARAVRLVHVLQRGAEVEEIVNITAIAVVAQSVSHGSAQV
ncbi:MAG: phosphate acyltransferase [Bryobacteraceae bacterium]